MLPDLHRSPDARPADAAKRRVLFLCTGNSCRSHMAEGWLRHLAGDRYESLSAGSEPAGFVHPGAVAAMAEVGVDLTGHTSKGIATFLPPGGTPPDVIVSVCSTADDRCPTFPGDVRRVRAPFEDPSHTTGTDEEKRDAFRRVRDEIRTMVEREFVNG